MNNTTRSIYATYATHVASYTNAKNAINDTK